ncbi:MAG: hypothetical protein HBSAPP04_25980 [Ignavibacteriaceae bacterium]|nr:MAG: hypothetical protein HBSAPP04_25980 [Ignavibacteriaceae bacterium]
MLDFILKNGHKLIPKRMLAMFVLHFGTGLLQSKGNPVAAFNYAARRLKLMK